MQAGAFVMLGLGLVLGIAWLLFASPYLRVERVIVRGAEAVSIDSVTLAASVEFGTPLALVRPSDLIERVSTLDRVGEVQIVRGWPHELVIEITERNPIAVTVISGEVLLVDDQGVAYTGNVSSAALPRVQALDDRSRKAAVAVTSALPDWLLADVAQTRASTPDDVTLVMRDGAEIVWGAPERADEKIDVLRVLLRLPSPIYDVSAPDVPTIRNATQPGPLIPAISRPAQPAID
jgi:cell division protein FtsQ